MDKIRSTFVPIYICYAVSSGLLIRRYASVPANTGLRRIGEFCGFAKQSREDPMYEQNLYFLSALFLSAQFAISL